MVCKMTSTDKADLIASVVTDINDHLGYEVIVREFIHLPHVGENIYGTAITAATNIHIDTTNMEGCAKQIVSELIKSHGNLIKYMQATKTKLEELQKKLT